ncbi:MAG: hypothetical protein HFJ45_00140 [Clostridia bacterium]|nr:hypothetical protein [Clostridia bacterium]
MKKSLNGTDMQVYDFGSFIYQSMPKKNGKYFYTNNLNRLVGIIKRNEEGRIEAYHGVIQFNAYDPQFYINVAFSDVMLRNAQRNNFGFIGYVVDNEKSYNTYAHKLSFTNCLGPSDDVTALSYALNHDGECNIPRRNLREIYEYIDQVLKLKIRGINKSNTQTKKLTNLNDGTYGDR